MGKFLLAKNEHPGLRIFVMLQFWNLFNAKGFASGKSSYNLSGCKGFVLIASAILVGQVLIVNIGQEFFNVVAINLKDWAIIIGSTSLVGLAGEALRFKMARTS